MPVTFNPRDAFRRTVMAGLNVKARLFGEPPVLDPLDPAFRRNPYPWYRALRERDPVHFHRSGFWLVSRYAEAVMVWTDPRFAHPPYADQARRNDAADSFDKMRGNVLIARNPPDHTRIKKILTDIFTKPFIESLRPRMEAVTDELLRRASAKGSMDIIADLARPLPVTLISEVLEIPVQDRATLTSWSATVFDAGDSAPTPEVRKQGAKAAEDFEKYFSAQVDERRRQPGTGAISKLIAAQTRDPDFTDDEMIANAALLFSAGHETTVSLIGSGVLLLLRNCGLSLL
jgi:cytochrome P450